MTPQNKSIRKSIELEIDLSLPDVTKNQMRLALPYIGIRGNAQQIATSADNLMVSLNNFCQTSALKPRRIVVTNETSDQRSHVHLEVFED